MQAAKMEYKSVYNDKKQSRCGELCFLLKMKKNELIFILT